jgi:hypothetical protein
MRKRNLPLILLLAVMFLSFAAPVCADEPTSGLESWWKAEGNANDSAGSNNGTLNGGVTYATGKAGQAFSFDGADDYVQTDYNFPFASDFTVAAWVKPHRMGDLEFIVGTEDGFGASCGGWSITWNVPASSGKFGFTGGCGGGENWTGSSTAKSYAVDQWHHVVGLFEGATGRIYVDGVLDVEFSRSCAIIAGTNMRMGIYPNRMERVFNGHIDEVKVYNRALTAREVANLAGFNFISQTGMPIGATIVSNPVTVSFISADAAISISDGSQYSISTDNGSSWGSWITSGTISPGNMVKVRLTSSSSNSAPTTATLTIGSVSSDFTVTTAASGDPNASGLVSW